MQYKGITLKAGPDERWRRIINLVTARLGDYLHRVLCYFWWVDRRVIDSEWSRIERKEKRQGSAVWKKTPLLGRQAGDTPLYITGLQTSFWRVGAAQELFPKSIKNNWFTEKISLRDGRYNWVNHELLLSGNSTWYTKHVTNILHNMGMVRKWTEQGY